MSTVKNLIAKFNRNYLKRIAALIERSEPPANGRLGDEFESYQERLTPEQLIEKLARQGYNRSLTALNRNLSATVLVLHASALVDAGDFLEMLAKPLSQRQLGGGAKLCPSSPFANEPSVLKGMGTGFFAKKNVIATAAHVIFDAPGGMSDLSDLRFVRGFSQNGTPASGKILVPKGDVFVPTQKSLPPDHYFLTTMQQDWALIEVEPLVPNTKVAVVKISRRRVTPGRELYAMGHGLALPLKISCDGRVLSSRKHYFECNLSLQGGDSGAPVFDARTHELVGIYVRGTSRIVPSIPGNPASCHVVHEVEYALEGQEVQRLWPVRQALSRIRNI